MAGKNGRFSKILQAIGIVDEPGEDFADGREFSGGREAAGNRDFRGSNTSYRGADNGNYRGNSRDSGRENRYETPFGYGNREYEGGSSSRYGGPARQQSYRSGQGSGYAPRGNVTPMPPRGNFQQETYNVRSSGRGGYDDSASGSRQRTVIYAIRNLEECQDVIVDLIEGKTTLVNLEDLRSELQQRALDTLAGASFALNAVLRKASDKIYLIAPSGVEINDVGVIERRY